LGVISAAKSLPEGWQGEMARGRFVCHPDRPGIEKQNPGRNSKIVVPDSGKATIYDFVARGRFVCHPDRPGIEKQNPGRNPEIVAPAFGKATIYDFEGLFWLPPAGAARLKCKPKPRPKQDLVYIRS